MAELTVTGSSIGDEHAYYAVSNSYPLTKPLGKTAAAGNSYGGMDLTRNSNSTSYFYVKFDVSAIPDSVEVNSVTGNIKLYASTTFQSRTTNREVQLFAGTTAKGSYEEFDGVGAARTYNLDGGSDWTREELSDIGIRVYCVRGISGTSSSTYLYWMGADVTIEYTEDSGVRHTITIQAGTGISVNKTSEQLKDRQPFELEITPQNGYSINTATDNDSDIKSQLQRIEVNPSETASSYPTAYTTSGNISGTRYKNCIGKGSNTTASGNDYSNSSSSSATIYYSFDFSDIPNNATIESVNVVVGGHAESTSNSNRKADLQLYSGDTVKGSKTSFTSTSKQLVTMDAGTWTRDELQEAKLAFTIGYYGGLVNGVDFDVVYSVPGSGRTYYIYTISSVTGNHTIRINMDAPVGTALRVKINGTYKVVTKILKKENGTYVEKTENDLSQNNIFWIE